MEENPVKRFVAVLVLTLLVTTVSVLARPIPGYEFRTLIGVPCGGDVPTDLCSSLGDPIAQTKTLLNNYMAQGWQLVSTSRMLYSTDNEGVVFLLGRSPFAASPVKPQQFDIIMATSCGQGPNGLPFRMCTGSGVFLDQVLTDHSTQGFQLINTTSCNYKYDAGQIGMVVYVFLK